MDDLVMDDLYLATLPIDAYQTRTYGTSKNLPPMEAAELEPCPECNADGTGHGDARCTCDAGFRVDRKTAKAPCRFMQGERQKVAIIAARKRYGLPLWNPLDAQEQFSDRVVEWAFGDDRWDDE